jgi:hypothetical protein
MRERDFGLREWRQAVVCSTEDHDSKVSVVLQLLDDIGREIDRDFSSISCVFASCTMINFIVITRLRRDRPLHSTTDVKALTTV